MTYHGSKPLSGADKSSFDFEKDMLRNDPSYSIKFDRIQYDSASDSYVIVEIIRIDTLGLLKVTNPFDYDPNAHYRVNRKKFELLWELCASIKANLYIVVYSENNAPYNKNVLVLHVQEVDGSKASPIAANPTKMNLDIFSTWLRSLNSRGR